MNSIPFLLSDFESLSINEELHEASPTRKTLPFQSLLAELHTLTTTIEESTKNVVQFPYDFRVYFSKVLDLRHQIRSFNRELRFLQMVFIFLKNFIFSNHGHGDWFEALNYIQTIAETESNPVKEATADLNDLNASQALNSSVDFNDYKQWVFGVSKFLEAIDEKIKPDLEKFCLRIVDWLLEGNSSGEYDISEFIDVVFLKLMDLEISRPNMIVPVKKQMETLQVMLRFVSTMSRKETYLEENLKNLFLCFQPWVNIAAAIVILYWADRKDEDLFAVVSAALQKFNLSIVEVAEAYIVVVKALKPTNASEVLFVRETVGRITDMVLENLIVSTDDRFEMLREGITLWIALLMDPPRAIRKDDKLICAQAKLLVDEAESLFQSLYLDKWGEDIAQRRNLLLNNFLEKMKKAKTVIRQLRVEIPGFSWNFVPQMNRRGFFDFLLGNLQKKLEAEGHFFPFEKHLIAVIHKELALLMPSLKDIFELQEEHEELRDIWVQASNVAYLVNYVTDSCLSFIDVPIWSHMMHLSNAIEYFQLVNTEVFKFGRIDQMNKNRVTSAKENSKLVLTSRQQANTTNADDIKVGFVDEEKRIIDRLTAGEIGLDIVAIVGMPGQGKTTLAQRVSQDSRVEHHFHKCAWCCISQEYDIKQILQVILKNVSDQLVSPKQFHYLTQEDLADRLRKCLKGRRYLVVLDDMWDAKAWYDLQLSFPDDNNGSRILLTSRNQHVPLEANPHCCIVKLSPLTFEESWKLLQMKAFEKDFCPPSLSNIGKTIAENCKGLPLAIVVVAGLLKKDKSVDSWKAIYRSLKSQLKSEGCMSILELSYNHLPDYLKPCFLYLGAFQEDQIIDAKCLIQFWIAEGFIRNDGRKNMEIVANEHLMDLVSRSLVFVAQRTSRYGIKKCRVHDLLRELCLIKAKEDVFLLKPNISSHSLWRRSDKDKLHVKWEPFFSDYPSHYLRRIKLVRVLDMSQVFLRHPIRSSITQLIHLRFLSVACLYPIPSSIVNLYRLEVLRLVRFAKSGVVGMLPSAVMKMANLRHVFVRNCGFEYTDNFDFDEFRVSPPLTKLETFNSLEFGTGSFFEMVAQKLPNVLKLGLTLSFRVCLSRYFKKLESLKLCISHSREMVVSPFTFDFPLTLKKLNLAANPQLSGTMMSSIGKLSNLEVLKLHARFDDKTWTVEDDEFLNLKYLEFKCSSIQEWNVSDDSFPCLEQLVIRNCCDLGELSGRFGAIATLKRIDVSNCSGNVSNSFQQIVDDQIDSGNEDLQFSIS